MASEHSDRVEVALFPPFPWLLGVAEMLDQTGIELGAQDCFWEMSGAYTGEVSPAMLKGWCQWVLVGHSERRAYLGETDEMVARKAAAALSSDLSVIMCVGELDEHYVAGKGDEVVSAQVRSGLSSCSADDSSRLVIAYEPIWAIGTGKSADPEHAYKTMRLIRRVVGETIGAGAAFGLISVLGDPARAATLPVASWIYAYLPRQDPPTVILIFTLIQHPEGVAGAFYKRMHRGKRPGPTREERVFSRRRASTAGAEP